MSIHYERAPTHPAPQGYFVTMIAGRRIAYLAGPFGTHDEALRLVPACRAEAGAIDAFAHFHAFGTARSDRARPGVLNGRLGIADTTRQAEAAGIPVIRVEGEGR